MIHLMDYNNHKHKMTTFVFYMQIFLYRHIYSKCKNNEIIVSACNQMFMVLFSLINAHVFLGLRGSLA